LKKEMDKDQQEVNFGKEKMIKEIKSFDRSKMGAPKPKKKRKSLKKKILMILGNG